MLASLAVRVRLDGFAKVKEVMDKMVVELKAGSLVAVFLLCFC